jgi:hypothetical protein
MDRVRGLWLRPSISSRIRWRRGKSATPPRAVVSALLSQAADVCARIIPCETFLRYGAGSKVRSNSEYPADGRRRTQGDENVIETN